MTVSAGVRPLRTWADSLVADAESHRALGGGSVGLDDQNEFAYAIRVGLYRFRGNEQCIA